MARTRQNAKRSTGGNASHRQLATLASRKTIGRKVVERVAAWEHVPDKLWDVYKLTDFRYDPVLDKSEVQVMWDWRAPGKRYRYKSWEPFEEFETTFAAAIEFIHEWHRFNARAEDKVTLEQYRQQHEEGYGMLGANASMSCAFESLKLAAELSGRPSEVQQLWIDEYIETNMSNGIDLSSGCKWKHVHGFVTFARDHGSSVFYKVLKRNLIDGVSVGPHFLGKLPLRDGFYVAGAYNSAMVGHSFVVKVSEGGSKRKMIDPSGTEDFSWIDLWSYVRRFEFA